MGCEDGGVEGWWGVEMVGCEDGGVEESRERGVRCGWTWHGPASPATGSSRMVPPSAGRVALHSRVALDSCPLGNGPLRD